MTAPLKPVALVSTPSLSAQFPSFQLALLKPTLETAGIPVECFSLFMRFAARIGWALNEALAEVHACMLGEWIWSRAAFADARPAEPYLIAFEDELEQIADRAGVSIDDFVTLREETAPQFIAACLETIEWSRFGLIGLSVVFQQTLATVALARALKSKYPEIPIILGGATFEDDIAAELMDECPEIDFIHCGDGDLTFPEMVQRLYRGESVADVRGLYRRQDGRVIFNGRAPNLEDLNRTPIPDFDEYFAVRKETGYDAHTQSRDVMLPIETARGCWWGMKNHCTFCGLNRAGMDFRAKDPPAVLEMIRTLSRKYDQLHFNAIDNILAPEYIEALFGKLADAHTDVQIHYEVRPSLSRAQLRRMKQGGLCSVQPGIESFSTHVLKLMKKHTTGMRNLEFLKWCTYYKIENLYNILLGFAGETEEDYAEQCRLIRKIHHLQPPYAITKARADRGSPMFTQPELCAIRSLRPSPCYPHIYPERFDLEKVSYYFEHSPTRVLEDRQYREIFRLVDAWKTRWTGGQRPTLTYWKSWDTLFIEDFRGPAPKARRLQDREAELYELCADARKPEAIRDKLKGDTHWVDEALARFLDEELMVELDGAYLSLALPANPDH